MRKISVRGRGESGAEVLFPPLFAFNCSNIKINLFRLIIQLILNSSFKDIQRQIGIVLCYTHRRLDAENLFARFFFLRFVLFVRGREESGREWKQNREIKFN